MNDWNAPRLSDYSVLLRRRWPTLTLCLLVGLGVAGLYLRFVPPEYVARTAVLVTSSTSGEPNSADRAGNINLDTEAQLVTSTEIVSAAADRLGVDEGVGDLVDRVRVSVPPNTEILEIAYVGTSARDAQRGSMAFAEAYLDQRRAAAEAGLEAEESALQTRIDSVTAELADVLKEAAALPADSAAQARAEEQASVLNNQLASLVSQQSQVKAATVSPGRIVTEPALPRSPSSPDPLIALVAGAVIGLLVGVGVAALRHRFDDVLNTPEELFQRTRVPVAAVIGGRLQDGEVNLVQPLSSDGRGFARLRNLVTTSSSESDRRVVLVAGVRRGGGPVAANLAASLARAGENVHLVCADVFGNTQEALFGQEPAPGLAEVLAGEQTAASAVRPLPGLPALKVLGPGRDPDRADALLQTRSLRRLVDDLLESSDYVVLEAPATTDSADAQTLANVAEVALLVVEAGVIRGRDVLDACAQLESMGTPVLGAVVARYDRGRRSAGPGTNPARGKENGPADPSEIDAVSDENRRSSSAEHDGATEPVLTAQNPTTQNSTTTNSERGAAPAEAAVHGTPPAGPRGTPPK